MKLNNILKYFNKNSADKIKLEQINEKLPENDIICQEILYKYNNKNTKIVKDDNIKGSYYVYLNDTIYLANNEKIKNAIYRVVLIAHECRHSLQSKGLQKLNFIFSNAELVLFVLFFILGIFKLINKYIILLYLLILIFAILFRLILEFDAVRNSFKIAKEYIERKTTKEDANVIEKLYSLKAKLIFPVMILQLFLGKLIRVGILILMYIFIK